jgi:hypothetical protein
MTVPACPHRGQLGSAALLTLVLIVLAAGVLAGLSRLGAAAHAAARTEAIADVTALAAAGGGRPAADQVARSSGAALVDLVVLEDERVVVTVRRDRLLRGAAARSVRVDDDGYRDRSGG